MDEPTDALLLSDDELGEQIEALREADDPAQQLRRDELIDEAMARWRTLRCRNGWS